jgi:hypothetical protein
MKNVRVGGPLEQHRRAGGTPSIPSGVREALFSPAGQTILLASGDVCTPTTCGRRASGNARGSLGGWRVVAVRAGPKGRGHSLGPWFDA